MPSSHSKSWVLLTLLAILALTSALDLDGIAHYMHNDKRQSAVGTGVSSAPTSSAASETPTPSSTPDSSSETPAPSSSLTSDTPTSATAAPSSAASSEAASSTPVSSNAVSTPASKTTKSSAQPSLYTSALVQTSVEQFVTVTTVVSGSSTFVQTHTGSRTVAKTTGFATATAAPNSSGNGNGGSGGMSSKTKSIIGGVVGGVGGAILLGGLALVAWRVWGRKKRVSDDDNDLMMGTGSAVGEKPANAQNTPFQTNLEQYHNPGGRPNAAANF